jgi:hypothetical protein
VIQDLFPLLIWLLELAVLGLTLFAVAKTFRRAGQPPWAALVPVYNLVTFVRIAGRPVAPWTVLLFLPVVNVVVLGVLSVDVARRFGRGPGFGVGLAYLPFVFYPLLAFEEQEAVT